jgi:hypothetical protein
MAGITSTPGLAKIVPIPTNVLLTDSLPSTTGVLKHPPIGGVFHASLRVPATSTSGVHPSVGGIDCISSSTRAPMPLAVSRFADFAARLGVTAKAAASFAALDWHLGNDDSATGALPSRGELMTNNH